VRALLVHLADGSGLGREAARRAARSELSRREYSSARPSLATRLVGRLLHELGRLIDAGSARVPGGSTGLILLLLLLAGVVALIIIKLRPVGGRSGAQSVFAGSAALDAKEHRRLAEAAAAKGEWAEAVRERLRAVVRELEDRGVLDRRPGRTASEVAQDGGALVPALALPLRRAAVTFDEVWYGGRTADAASYATVVEVDGTVTSTRLVLV